MRVINLFMPFLFLTPVPATSLPAGVEEDGEKGFVEVFNGKDLSGWTGDLQGYAVQDEVLVCQEGSTGNLYLAEPYSNFILRFEFRLEPGSNNGVGLRVEKDKHPSQHGIEIQILDDSDPRYAQILPYQYHGSIYGIVPSRTGHLKKVGEWNSQEIYANGDHIRVTLNGTVIVDARLREAVSAGTLDGKEHPGLFNPTGYLGFLGHGDRVEFRHIRVKKLP